MTTTDQHTKSEGTRATSREARESDGIANLVPLWVWQVAFGVVMLALWEILSDRVLDPFFFSSPSRVAGYLVDYVGGAFVGDLTFTLQAAVVGYALGATFGLLSGFVLAAARMVARVLNPYILAVYGIPRIALAPLFIVWFGIGMQSKIYMAALMAFFLTFFNTYTGVQQVDQSYVNIARVAGASRVDVNRKVVLPAASPWIIAGLRVSIPYAIVAALVGEFIASTEGIGYRIALMSQQFNTTGTMGGVLIVMVLVLLANLVLNRAEARILRWQPNRSESGSAI